MEVVDLQRALEQMMVERDAAIVAKEDVLGQLRMARRRLKDAEEEQYKAEQDATALRAELQTLQQSDKGVDTSFSYVPDHQEIAAVKSELEEMWTRLQQEQLKLATERQRNAALTVKVKELEDAKEKFEAALSAAKSFQPDEDEVASASITVQLEGASSVADGGATPESRYTPSIRAEIHSLKAEKAKHEAQMHELAVMVERLEKGRQKLLAEIDAQSLEIERLFVENSGLELTIKETSDIAAQWENQVQQCLERNAVLRSKLNHLRVEHADALDSLKFDTSETAIESLRSENTKLRHELVDVRALSEEQTSQLAQLTADLNRAVLTTHGLRRQYKPILATIENRLRQLKQDSADENSLF